jgi:hypothetical protein
MLRYFSVFMFFSISVCVARSQSIPSQILDTPTRLELDRATREVAVGSTVTCTVRLKDVRDQVVTAPRDIPLDVETPEGKQAVTLPAGQSSAKFTWNAAKTGVAQVTVRSGRLHPANGLVLVAPPAARINPEAPPHALAPEEKEERPVSSHKRPAAEKPAPGHRPAAPASEPLPLPPPPVAAPSPAAPVPQPGESKLAIYITPAEVLGNPITRAWKANVAVAVLNKQGSLVPVTSGQTVHLNTTLGSISPADITLSPGQDSNFQDPGLLISDRSGQAMVEAVSTLGPSGPVEVNYLLPPPTQLRIALGSPVLSGTGSSSVTVQICLLDASGGVTSSDKDIPVSLIPSSGELKVSSPVIRHDLYCTDPMEWTSASSGPASILAESGGLTPGKETLTFPTFPWYFVWLAAIGGLLGAFVKSRGKLFSGRWLSHTWQGLVLGAVLGVIFYLFARVGAVVLPKNFPVILQNIPVVSGVGAFLLGFLGGVLGRTIWKVDKNLANSSRSSGAV